MRVIRRWLLFPLVVLLVLAAALGSLLTVTVRGSFPVTEGEVTLPGLYRDVEVIRDGSGVPHVYAADPEDLFTAQGYLHAQEHFFQMDLQRRVGSGRLSELIGADGFAADAYARTLGFRRVAEAELALLSGEDRRSLDAYTSGVNNYLASRSTDKIALEYVLLGVGAPPPAWSPVDSLVVLKVAAWSANLGWLDEIGYASLARTMGVSQVSDLRARNTAKVPPITAGAPPVDTPAAGEPVLSAAWSPALLRTLGVDDALGPWLGDRIQAETSGAVAVALGPARTTGGRPLLAGTVQGPARVGAGLQQVGLHCAVRNDACPYDVSGFARPGVPGLISGHNGRAAWMLSHARVDTQDVVIERIDGGVVQRAAGSEGVQYRSETIGIRGADPRTIEVRSTTNGPLLSDVAPQLEGLGEALRTETDAVALRATLLTPTATLGGLLAMTKSRDFTEFREAAGHVGQVVHLTYADTNGAIGYQLAGAIPRRGDGDGSLPVPGWDDRFAWTPEGAGWAVRPLSELPSSANPAQGVIVAADQQISDAPAPGGGPGPVANQLWAELDTGGGFDVARTQDLLADARHPLAATLVPELLRVPLNDSWVAEGQQVLIDWDREMTADSAGAAYFQMVVDRMLDLTFDEMPASLPVTPSGTWYALLAELLADPEDPLWDIAATPATETRQAILTQAMTEARREITAQVAQSPRDWSWGKLHRVRLAHPLQDGIGGPLISPDRGPVAGGAATVAGFAQVPGSREVTTAPQYRMVIDLADVGNSRWGVLTGTSGHAGHNHYLDQTRAMMDNRLQPWPYLRDQVDATTDDRLRLRAG